MDTDCDSRECLEMILLARQRRVMTWCDNMPGVTVAYDNEIRMYTEILVTMLDSFDYKRYLIPRTEINRRKLVLLEIIGGNNKSADRVREEFTAFHEFCLGRRREVQKPILHAVGS